MSCEMEDVSIIMNNIDFNKSGYIEFSEFIAGAMSREPEFVQKKVELLFKVLDTRNQGFVTFADFKENFKNIQGKVLTERVWEDLIDEADPSKNGFITLSDLKNVLGELE